MCVCVRERERALCVCVCVRERERERGRERETCKLRLNSMQSVYGEMGAGFGIELTSSGLQVACTWRQ